MNASWQGGNGRGEPLPPDPAGDPERSPLPSRGAGVFAGDGCGQGAERNAEEWDDSSGVIPAALAPTVMDLAQFRGSGLPRSFPRPGSGEQLHHVAGYELLGELGRGGMGVVYLARQASLGRLVALKMALPDQEPGADLARFRSEAEAVARLSHPNIVQVYEVGEHEGRPFFSLEFCDGGSLDRFLGRPLAASSSARLVRTLARAVQYAHEQGIVHRDLKPANILLQMTSDQSPMTKQEAWPSDLVIGHWSLVIPKVSDFGLAKRLDTGAGLSRAGDVLGTPSYMAPEQAEGRPGAVGPWTDVYALGAILYEMITGRVPFTGETVWDTLRLVQAEDPVPPAQLSRACPRDLETICLKCLQKEPRLRYASALDLAEDLRCFLEGEPIRARPLGPMGRLVKWARRRPAAAGLVLTTALLVVGVAGAIPLHIARLEHKVAESNAEVLRQRDLSRRARLRAECQQALVEGRRILGPRAQPPVKQGPGVFGRALCGRGVERERYSETPGLEEARVLFATVQRQIDDRDAREDPELRRLREEAAALLAEARRLGEGHAARQLAAGFLAWRDEAFFQLNRDVLDGLHADGARASREAARKALKAFPDLKQLDPPEREQLQVARVEVLLILAEATARPQPGDTPAERQRRARDALGVIDQVKGLAGPRQAVHRRRARYLERLGDRAGATAESARAALMRPETALDWFLAGYDRWLGGDVAGALHDFDQALSIQSDLFWAQFFRAVCHQRLHNPSEARASLTFCIARRPDFIWLYLLRGFLHGQVGDLEAANKDFDKAEELTPDSFARYVIHLNRGVLALHRGETGKATAEFARAARERPDGYHAQANLAEAYRRQGKLTRAAEALDTAVRLEPRRPELYRTRARLCLQRNDPAGALRDLDEAIRLGPGSEPGIHVERGQVLFWQQRTREALDAANEALRLRPDLAEAHRLRGDILLHTGHYQEAEAALTRSLAASKPDPDTLRQRGLARSALGDHTHAIEDYSRALGLRPRDARIRALRGWAYLASEAPRPALNDFEEILHFSFFDFRLSIGSSLGVSLPLWQSAIGIQQSKIILSELVADACNGRGLARARLGMPREAAADAEQALRLRPHSTRLVYNAARVLAQSAGARPGGHPLPLAQQTAYQQRALQLLREAIKLLPERERATFWRRTVRQDSALTLLRRNSAFQQLDRAYGQAAH
jgi:eukaryotic-like serine/threonine-protein kinase